jgi:FKBP-type peptidyl-prolyl cis-trans isomerase 2
MRLALLVLILFLGCISTPDETESNATIQEPVAVAEVGDYVVGEYSLHDYDLFLKKERFEEVLGDGEVLLGIEEALIGMKVGESKEVELPPEKAFGLRNASLLHWEPRAFTLPKKVNLSQEEFREAFGSAPEEGVAFERGWLRMRVIEVGQSHVLLEREPLYSKVNITGGVIQITQNATHINYFFTPKLNLTVIDAKGEFVTYRDANATHVLVDRNHPLAGRRLSAEVKLLKLVKKEELEKMRIFWREDISEAIREAVGTDRVVLVYFYSRDCEGCAAMEEAFQDARLRLLADELIFVRLDLAEEASLAARYGVARAPAIVILNSRGETLAKLEDELSAQEIRQTLQELRVIF